MEDMNQKNFGDIAIPEIKDVNEAHMALCFLLDTSGSMAGQGIEELNKGINLFKEQVCQDEQTRRILDVSIIAFNGNTTVVQEFVPVEHMQPVALQAGGQTFMAPALREAMRMVNDRVHLYRRSGTESYKPWVILISDGEPLDNIDDAVSEVYQMTEEGKLRVYSFGVGGCNMGILHKISGNNVFRLENYDFTSFFDWLNKSMRTVSQSAPGDKMQSPEMPRTMILDM